MANPKCIVIAFLFLCCIDVVGCETLRKLEITTNLNESTEDFTFKQYSSRMADKNKSGVVVYDPEHVDSQYYWMIGACFIMDVKGKIIKKFTKEFPVPFYDNQMFIVLNSIGSQNGNRRYWSSYDLHGKLLWERKDIFIHHDFFITKENTILTLTKDVYIYNNRTVEWDRIIEISSEGEIVFEWSTYLNHEYLSTFHKKLLLDEPSSVDVPIVEYTQHDGFAGEYDYYYINSIQELPENDLSKKDERFKAGNVLISLPNVNSIAILNKETKKIEWFWGSNILEFPHTPRMLPNGNILVLDNGTQRGYTRVLEIDPINENIVWEYKGNPPESFYSPGLGSAERLSNGNTLIADGENGRAFEVTKKGTIVWEWYYPEINDEGRRRKIYRITTTSKEQKEQMINFLKKKNANEV